ncbi:MAG: caspase family protein [Chloroflexi bacterium]|nr:caspase family protein [Chloroflexota bacterium]
MTEVFENGYAVVVGVDSNNIKRLALPTVAEDVQAVHDVLVHPERCAYKPENVKLLKGEESTNKNILDALYWLQEKVEADTDATAVVYYSGHGMVDKKTDQYYLIPYDIRALGRVRADAIRADVLTAEISSVNAQRMLVVLDCCHAAGMGVKDVDLDAIGDDDKVKSTAFPLDLPETKDIPSFDVKPGAKAVSELSKGEGRAILNSSTGDQSSYVRKDGEMSLFTYHLIEALTGHAPHPDDATVVYVTDVMSWVTHEVEKSAKREGVEQTPVMRTSGVFPVAQLIGGKGLAKGLGAVAPDPLAPLPPAGTTFNQQGQTVHGPQVNVGGDAHIGQIGDNINTGGGDYVGGDKTVHEGDTIHGDKVGGDKVSGDKISVGSISGSQGVAIGSGASANVNIQQGVSGDELNQLFTPLLATVAQQDPTAVAKVQALKAEAGKGEDADDEKMADLIGDIADAVPSAVEGLANLFTNSIVAKAAGGATKYILKRIRK